MFGKISLIWLMGLALGIIPYGTLISLRAQAGTGGGTISEESLLPQARIKLGIEVLLESQLDLLQGKRVGLITNPTGVNSNLKSTADLLWKHPEVKLVALFGPEHGIRGDIAAGVYVPFRIDEKTGLPAFSLYGPTRKPTSRMLKGIDVLVFDIQDVGTRYYTYISTMALAMKAAREEGIKFVVLDRPNPLGGIRVAGPVLEENFTSFIGMFPIPIMHGMTVGELAKLFNEDFGIGSDLTVVKMEGWRREMFFEDTGLQWIKPSPNIPTPLTAQVYPATGFVGEVGGICVGIGTTRPFELVGTTWVDARKLARKLNRQQLPGVHFRPVHYRRLFRDPERKFHGVQIHILDREKFRPVETGIHIISALKRLNPEKEFRRPTRKFDISMGTDKIRLALEVGKYPKEIIAAWQDGLKEFLNIRRKFLLYN